MLAGTVASAGAAAYLLWGSVELEPWAKAADEERRPKLTEIEKLEAEEA